MVGQLVKSSYRKPNFHSFYAASILGNYPFGATQYIHYCASPSSASIETESQPYVPQIPTNLSEWNLKYCYLVLGAISPGLENDHTSFEELQRDLFLVIRDFQHTSL